MSRAASTLNSNLNYGKYHASVSVNCENITLDLLLYQSLPTKFTYSDADGEKMPFAAHDHAVLELFIIENGSMRINVTENVELEGGDMLMIRPRTPHQIVYTSDNIKYFSIRFSMRRNGKLLDTDMPPYRKDCLSSDNHAFVCTLISELRRTVPEVSTVLEMYRIKSQLAIIISYALEKFVDLAADTPAESDNQIDLYTKIENYLYLNYDQQLTLESLAAHLSYSRTQMRRILEACYGMPFTKKLREIRLGAAKKYLTETELSIDEIAEKCGYETRQGFESMFLKYVGVTPNKYRKSVTE